MNTPRFDLGLLLDMLTYRRPAGSQTETVFIDRYIAPLPGASRDRFGNWHVIIGQSPIVWSCHTDTVHSVGGYQTVRYDAVSGEIGLSRRSKKGPIRSSCLGADDTAGVFLLVSLIRAGVAGHYIFHYGEEIGGEGSADLAANEPEHLADARFAIALDRRGFGDIITHQAFSRCASDAFAISLAEQLNVFGLDYKPCETGVFTDTANYTDAIGECTNLSVGYFDEHTRRETVNAHHLARLLPALAAVDPTLLVDSRKPAESDGRSQQFRWRGWDSRSSVVMFEACEYCGEVYDPSVSFASRFDVYCSPECETADWQDIIAKHSGGSAFLDPIYDDLRDRKE